MRRLPDKGPPDSGSRTPARGLADTNGLPLKLPRWRLFELLALRTPETLRRVCGRVGPVTIICDAGSRRIVDEVGRGQRPDA